MLAKLIYYIALTLALMLVYIVTLWAVERISVRGELPPVKRRLHYIWLLSIYSVIGVFFYGVVGLFVRMPEPLLPVSGLTAVVAAFVLTDLCFYLQHRLQHAIPLLWRFHKVHHSSEHLVSGAGFHHPTHLAIEWLCIVVPVGILVGPERAILVNVIMSMHGQYLHSSVGIQFGRLGRWIVDNQGHRIHHSKDPAHFDKNFGAPTLIWDRLFGTYHKPVPDEWPDTGLDDHREPRTVMEWAFPSHATVKADNRSIDKSVAVGEYVDLRNRGGVAPPT